MPQVVQDPNAHVFWDVEWGEWLAKRNLNVASVTGYSWSVPSPVVKTQEANLGTKARVYLQGVPLGETVRITCTITVANPDAGPTPVTDDFSFDVVGKHQ